MRWTKLDKIDEMDKKIEKSLKMVEILKEENLNLKKAVSEQEERIYSLERDIRRKNIVVYGVDEELGETETKLTSKVTNILGSLRIAINGEIDL